MYDNVMKSSVSTFHSCFVYILIPLLLAQLCNILNELALEKKLHLMTKNGFVQNSKSATTAKKEKDLNILV